MIYSSFSFSLHIQSRNSSGDRVRSISNSLELLYSYVSFGAIYLVYINQAKGLRKKNINNSFVFRSILIILKCVLRPFKRSHGLDVIRAKNRRNVDE